MPRLLLSCLWPRGCTLERCSRDPTPSVLGLCLGSFLRPSVPRCCCRSGPRLRPSAPCLCCSLRFRSCAPCCRGSPRPSVLGRCLGSLRLRSWAPCCFCSPRSPRPVVPWRSLALRLRSCGTLTLVGVAVCGPPAPCRSSRVAALGSGLAPLAQHAADYHRRRPCSPAPSARGADMSRDGLISVRVSRTVACGRKP